MDKVHKIDIHFLPTGLVESAGDILMVGIILWFLIILWGMQ
jgi:hypothetical protein